MKGDIAIIMKTRPLLKTSLSLLLFTATTCFASFHDARDADTDPLQRVSIFGSTNALDLKDVNAAPSLNFGPIFNALPNEVILNIISYLDGKSLVSLSQTSTAFDNLVGVFTRQTVDQVRRNTTHLYHDLTCLKKGVLSVLKNDGFVFLPPAVPLPANTRPATLFENTLLFNRFFNLQREALSDADLLCLEAVCPLAFSEGDTPIELTKALDFIDRDAADPLPSVRLQENLEATKTQSAVTFVLTSAELITHKEALTAHLAKNPEHRLHLILGDGIFEQDGTLSLSKEDVPDNLRHLILSDPRKTVITTGEGLLKGHPSLTTFDARDLSCLTVLAFDCLSECKDLTHMETRGLTSVQWIGYYFAINCKNFKTINPRGLISIAPIAARWFVNQACGKSTGDDYQKVMSFWARRGIQPPRR
ncbi:MAG: F-box protein [Alphaproteobacteria bacterium]|jgi:hypothetical protein